jgi:hypothetical protein
MYFVAISILLICMLICMRPHWGVLVVALIAAGVVAWPDKHPRVAYYTRLPQVITGGKDDNNNPYKYPTDANDSYDVLVTPEPYNDGVLPLKLAAHEELYKDYKPPAEVSMPAVHRKPAKVTKSKLTPINCQDILETTNIDDNTTKYNTAAHLAYYKGDECDIILDYSDDYQRKHTGSIKTALFDSSELYNHNCGVFDDIWFDNVTGDPGSHCAINSVLCMLLSCIDFNRYVLCRHEANSNANYAWYRNLLLACVRCTGQIRILKNYYDIIFNQIPVKPSVDVVVHSPPADIAGNNRQDINSILEVFNITIGGSNPVFSYIRPDGEEDIEEDMKTPYVICELTIGWDNMHGLNNIKNKYKCVGAILHSIDNNHFIYAILCDDGKPKSTKVYDDVYNSIGVLNDAKYNSKDSNKQYMTSYILYKKKDLNDSNFPKPTDKNVFEP